MKKLILLLFIPLFSLSSFGQTVEKYFNSGYEKAEAKDHSGAIRDYNIAIELKPNDANIYFNRGYSKLYLKD